MTVKTFAILVVILSVYQEIFSQEIFLSNFNTKCLRCLCAASSNCDFNFGCQNGFCGPFLISKAYYLDAVKDTEMDTSDEAFEKCSLDIICARKVVKYYLARFAKDCNGDGVTDCTDYAMINFNGGYGCELDLYRNPYGKQFADRYFNCFG